MSGYVGGIIWCTFFQAELSSIDWPSAAMQRSLVLSPSLVSRFAAQSCALQQLGSKQTRMLLPLLLCCCILYLRISELGCIEATPVTTRSCRKRRCSRYKNRQSCSSNHRLHYYHNNLNEPLGGTSLVQGTRDSNSGFVLHLASHRSGLDLGCDCPFFHSRLTVIAAKMLVGDLATLYRPSTHVYIYLSP